VALAQEISGSAFLFGGVNIKEHDCVVPTSHLPSEGLLSGDVGTFVHIHPDEAVYEVELIHSHRNDDRSLHCAANSVPAHWFIVTSTMCA